MTSNDFRRRAKQRIEGLPAALLPVADHFLAYLEERGDDQATRELLEIPGFKAAFVSAQREVASAKTTPVAKLRRK